VGDVPHTFVEAYACGRKKKKKTLRRSGKKTCVHRQWSMVMHDSEAKTRQSFEEVFCPEEDEGLSI
jgi:hypothetical protein